jgi:acyl-CoA reductase-like NAD-dependent aldehyde dehydrogenase
MRQVSTICRRRSRPASARGAIPRGAAAAAHAGEILHKVADLIESRVDELAKMQSRDNGKPLAEARGW